jgi:hypothetical protein
MAEPKVEAAWRNEFKRVHTTEPFGSVNVPNDPNSCCDCRAYRRGIVVCELKSGPVPAGRKRAHAAKGSLAINGARRGVQRTEFL